MSQINNPFLKDYSKTSLLKRNFGIFQLNSQVQQNKQSFVQQYKTVNQSSSVSKISNPFSKKTLNTFNLFKQKQNQKNSQVSKFRSLSQQISLSSHNFNKNIYYKGLQQIGSRQAWKAQVQKQARYKLKNYGPQSLKYEYIPSYKNSLSKQQKEDVQTPSFHQRIDIQNNDIKFQYYGYSGYQYKKEEDDFPIQRTKSKKPSLKKPASSGIQKNKHNKHSYFEQIPQDKNEDLGTMKFVKESVQPSLQIDGFKQNSNKFYEQKRSSIENFRGNFQPQSSASSGFGTSSQMYQSGANFKFRSSFNTGGPLNAHTFDAFDDQKMQNHEERISREQQSPRSGGQVFPQTLQYNNKIYYSINL